MLSDREKNINSIEHDAEHSLWEQIGLVEEGI